MNASIYHYLSIHLLLFLSYFPLLPLYFSSLQFVHLPFRYFTLSIFSCITGINITYTPLSYLLLPPPLPPSSYSTLALPSLVPFHASHLPSSHSFVFFLSSWLSAIFVLPFSDTNWHTDFFFPRPPPPFSFLTCSQHLILSSHLDLSFPFQT